MPSIMLPSLLRVLWEGKAKEGQSITLACKYRGLKNEQSNSKIYEVIENRPSDGSVEPGASIQS